MTQPQQSVKAIYQAVWLKALREGEVEITLKTSAEAIRTRFALYNSVKGVRAGTEVSPELLHALTECSILLKDSTVTIRHKSQDNAFQAVAALVEGQVDAPSLSLSEQEIAESIARVQRLVDEPAEAPKPRVTPYYTRD